MSGSSSSSSGDDKLTDKLLEEEKPAEKAGITDRKLVIAFVAMCTIGLGNRIFYVLQFEPMQNYPVWVNLVTTFVYIPASFAYIIPMIRYGSAITPESRAIPQYKWAVMGCLDSIAGIMQTIATNYVASGALVIMLLQAAIPMSMGISSIILKTKYKVFQYVGAAVVACGIAVVLGPQFAGSSSSDDSSGPSLGPSWIWCIVLMLSCVPMSLSSVYKEKALGDADVDAIYMNGWVAVYQLIFSFVLIYPSAIAANVDVHDVWKNVWQGMKCYVGVNSNEGDQCPTLGPLYSNLYMFFNIGYNILIILILKYGGSNILYLTLTAMVPLGSIFFTFPFVPAKSRSNFQWETIVGLIVILGGLVGYRFWPKVEPKLESVLPACCLCVKRDAENEAKKKLLAADDESGDGLAVNTNSPSLGGGTPLRGSTIHIARGTLAKHSQHQQGQASIKRHGHGHGPAGSSASSSEAPM